MAECNNFLGLYFTEYKFANLLLQIDLSRRFGNLKDGAADIKRDRWFRPIDWEQILHRRAEPPFRPKCSSPGDASNFDTYEEVAIKATSTNKYVKEFEDF
jgi:protein kinase A